MADRGTSATILDSHAEQIQYAIRRLEQLAVDRFEKIDSLPSVGQPLSQVTTCDELKERLHVALPQQGMSLSRVMDYLLDRVAPLLNPGQAGSRYFGFVTGGVLPSALLAEWFTSLYDQSLQIHLPKETFSTVIEALTVDMVVDLLGLDRAVFTGTFTTGATASNLLALTCARETTTESCMERKTGEKGWSVAEYGSCSNNNLAPVQVFVAQAHASIRKTASIVGIGRANVIDVGQKVVREPTVEENMASLDFDLVDLQVRLEECHRIMQPAIVVVGMGEVVTGALTAQIPALREMCSRYNAWLHVDAAFAAITCLLDGYAWISQHMSQCDSITTDAHKVLNVPYDCGILLVKKYDKASTSLRCPLDDVCGPGNQGGPSYLAPVDARDDEDHDSFRAYIENIPSPLNRNIENSRRFRALPLYISLIQQGREGTSAMIQRQVDFASRIRQWIASCPYYELLTPSSPPLDSSQSSSHAPQPWKGHWTTIVIFFRPHPTECPILSYRDKATGCQAFIRDVKATKMMYISPGALNGVMGVRIAISNWATGLHDETDFQVTTSTLLQVMEKEK